MALAAADPVRAAVRVDAALPAVAGAADETNGRQEQLIADTLWVEQSIRFQLGRHEDSQRLIGSAITSGHLAGERLQARLATLARNNKELHQIDWRDAAGAVPAYTQGAASFDGGSGAVNGSGGILMSSVDGALPAAPAMKTGVQVHAWHLGRKNGKKQAGRDFRRDAGSMIDTTTFGCVHELMHAADDLPWALGLGTGFFQRLF